MSQIQIAPCKILQVPVGRATLCARVWGGRECHQRHFFANATSGKDSPVLLLHGHSATSIDMVPLAQALCAEGFCVISFDCRGIGLSRNYSGDAADEPYSLDDCVADAEAVVAAVVGEQQVRQLGGVHVFGISWGSFLAQRFAVLKPYLVRSLTLAGSALDVPAQGEKMLKRAPGFAFRLLGAFVLSPPRKGLSRDAYVEKRASFTAMVAEPVEKAGGFNGCVQVLRPVLKRKKGSSLDRPGWSREDEDWARTCAGQTFDENVVDWNNKGAKLQSAAHDLFQDRASLEKHATDLVQAISTRGTLSSPIPVLVLHGRQDVLHPIEAGRDLAGRLPGAKLIEMDCGHMLPWAAAARDLWLKPMVDHLEGA